MSVNHNHEDFGTTFYQYRERLLNSMTAVVRDRDVAEDITATAFAMALENLPRFRGESSMYSWIFRIGLNEARNRQRRNRTVSLDSIEGLEQRALREPDRTAESLERSDCRAKIRTALRGIPAVYRRTLVDHFVRGYPVKRIARQNRVPIGTVLSRIFAGKRILRRAFHKARLT